MHPRSSRRRQLREPEHPELSDHHALDVDERWPVFASAIGTRRQPPSAIALDATNSLFPACMPASHRQWTM